MLEPLLTSHDRRGASARRGVAARGSFRVAVQATVLTDLEDDYAAVRSTRAGLPAACWLLRETSSLVAA